mmetsp:Transcript_90227/g.188664  ORF Transcript_90227/g.188664 Transcript_90227/m.188664 type:complete len:449 (+) Transcript_90227:212-1558(+)
MGWGQQTRQAFSEADIPTRVRVLPISIWVVLCLMLEHGHARAGAATLDLFLSVGFPFRDVGRFQLTTQERIPVQPFEEWVLFDGRVAISPCAEALGWVLGEQALDHGNRVLAVHVMVEIVWKSQRQIQDFLVVVCKWELSNDKLIEANAQTPKIGGGCKPYIADHLWSHKHRGPSLAEALASNAHCDPKVNELEVALVIDKAILRLEIEIGDPSRMEELQSQNDGASIEHRLLPIQQTQLVQNIQEFSSRHELRQEVDALGAGEGPHTLDDEGVVDLHEDDSLIDNRFLLVHLHDRSLANALQGVTHAYARMSHHFHDSIAATSDDSHELQVLEFHFRVLELDAALEIVQTRTLHDFPECFVVHHPELRVLDGIDVGRSRLVEDECPLPEVVSDAQCTNNLVADHNLDSPLSQNVEMGPNRSLFDDASPILCMLNLKTLGQALQLLER